MSAPFRCIGALGCVGLLLGFGRLAGLFGIDERDVSTATNTKWRLQVFTQHGGAVVDWTLH